MVGSPASVYRTLLARIERSAISGKTTTMADREHYHFEVAFAGAPNLFSSAWPRPRRAGLCGYAESPLKNETKEETP
jgi:hypothetical protein